MNRVSFHGQLFTGDKGIVSRLLGDWLQVETLNVRDRLFGVEIVHEEERLYVYCYETFSAPWHYLLEGHTPASLEEAGALLQRLLRRCEASGVGARLEYVLESEDGRELGAEITVR